MASSSAFASQDFSSTEQSEIKDWQSKASQLSTADGAGLQALNSHLSTRTTILGSKPSEADVSIYKQVAPLVAKWSDEERTGSKGYHHIVRHVDFVQSSPQFGLDISEADKVRIDADQVLTKIPPIDLKAEKERKKKEKEAAAAAGGAGATTAATAPPSSESTKATLKEKVQDKLHAAEQKVASAVGVDPAHPTQKKEKKAKAPKPAKAPAAVIEKPLSPSLIDLRVGHILKCERHPNADSLYVSTMAVGDAAGTDNTSEHDGQVVRTVCSGLNGLVPLAEMQGRLVVAVCNLKPVTMRGIKSAAMVLAASPRLAEGEVDAHAGPVELVAIPAGAKAGDRVYFEGWQDGEPEAVLNPKKKVWETIQPGFTTTAGLEVAFDAAAVEALKGNAAAQKGVGVLRTKDGVCTVKTLTGATVR